MGRKMKKECRRQKKEEKETVPAKKEKKIVIVLGRDQPGYSAWLAHRRNRYHEIVAKSDGFDLCGLPVPDHFDGLVEMECTEFIPCPKLVERYAKLGLHRYNFINQGKNLELCSVKKYNKSTGSAASSYYITMEAKNPLLTFQARVNEIRYGRLLLNCSIARPLGETKSSNPVVTPTKLPTGFHITHLLPEMPDWFKPLKRFYVLNKSEVQANDWVRLYLELAVATTDRRSSITKDLSDLEILKVALETSTQDLEPSAELLRAYDLTTYIWYKDPCEARVGKDADRIAVVRRVLDAETHKLTLVGWTQCSETITPTRGGWIQSSETITPVGWTQSPETIVPVRKSSETITPELESSETITPKKCKNWRLCARRGLFKRTRLSTPRVRKAYKNRHGVGSARSLHI